MGVSRYNSHDRVFQCLHNLIGLQHIALRRESELTSCGPGGRAVPEHCACPFQLAGSPLGRTFLSARVASAAVLSRTTLPKDSVDSIGGQTLETFAIRVDSAGCISYSRCPVSNDPHDQPGGEDSPATAERSLS